MNPMYRVKDNAEVSIEEGMSEAEDMNPMCRGKDDAADTSDTKLYSENSVLLPGMTEDVAEQINISIKYEGYIKRQQKQVEHFLKMEEKKIPEDMDYGQVKNLRKEARQKLEAVRPRSIGQASRISGVSPADVSQIMLYLRI